MKPRPVSEQLLYGLPTAYSLIVAVIFMVLSLPAIIMFFTGIISITISIFYIIYELRLLRIFNRNQLLTARLKKAKILFPTLMVLLALPVWYGNDSLARIDCGHSCVPEVDRFSTQLAHLMIGTTLLFIVCNIFTYYLLTKKLETI